MLGSERLTRALRAAPAQAEAQRKAALLDGVVDRARILGDVETGHNPP